MSVADLSRQGSSSSGSAEYSCPHYLALPGSKRCESYQEGGTCARSDRFLCSEWEKLNRSRHAPTPPTSEVAAKTEPGTTDGPTDLFGNPAPELDLRREEPKPEVEPTNEVPHRIAVDEMEESLPARGLTDEDIESFKELGAEVCLRSESFGEIWLVPEHTGRDRKEITPEHAATICQVTQTFPGSQVVSFEKNPKPNKENDA